MLKAWLVTNGFLQEKKFQEIYQWLVESAKRKNVDMKVKTNDELLFCLGSCENVSKVSLPDFVIFWDKDVRLAKNLESKGVRLFNSAHAIEICDDKSLTHLMLEKQRIPMPKTWIAPMTFQGIGYTHLHFLEKIKAQLGFPMVIKECFGSFGQQVYLVSTEEELVKKVKELEGKPFLFQEFIQSSFAKDLRLQVVGEEVVATMYRYGDNGDFRANISNGGKMKNYVPTKEQKDLAVKACKATGADFAGVDILFGPNHEPLVCEVNSNAHFKNIFDCTGVSVADYILEYIIKELK